MSKYIEAMARMTAKRLDDITLDLVKRLDQAEESEREAVSELGEFMLEGKASLQALDEIRKETAEEIRQAVGDWAKEYTPENNVATYTAAVLVMNWKIWENHDKGETDRAGVYAKLWQEWDEQGFKIWKGEDLAYFIRELD